MNARQRRGVLLLSISALCALGVFAGVLALVRNVQSKVGAETTAYELTRDIPAYTPLSAGQVHKVRIPKRWLPETAVTDLGELRGKVAGNALHKGALLQTGMMADRPELKPDEQEIAIMIDAATGVAGKIRPGDHVNIYATFSGDRTGDKSHPAQAKVLVTDARVIDVGKLTPFAKTSDENRRTDRKGVPITFALDTLDAQRVAYAESFAEHVRLALIAPGSKPVPDADRTYTLSGDK
jgi:pilus assembly protein CpaB